MQTMGPTRSRRFPHRPDSPTTTDPGGTVQLNWSPPAPTTSLGEELSRLAEIAPETAVVTAYHRIEARLVEMLAGFDMLPISTLGGRGLARMARQKALISEETLGAIEGLSVLRDLTAHGGGEIGVDRAREYLALADAVLYALRSKPSG